MHNSRLLNAGWVLRIVMGVRYFNPYFSRVGYL
jgi:hypothetical protein